MMLVTFLAFVSIGFPDAVLGVAWPSIRETFDRPLGNLGFLLFASGIGYFTSGISAGKAIEILGVGRLLAVSTSAVSIGLFSYAVAPRFWLLMIIAALIGFGSGAVDAGLNFYASEHFSVTVMNWLHAFFAFGAMIGPFIMAGVLATQGNWRVGYLIVAIVVLVMAVIFGTTANRWSDGEHHGDVAHQAPVNMMAVLRNPLVWTQIVIFFFMAGIEASAGAWTYTLLFEKFGQAEGTAGVWAGFFWGAMAVGRLALAPLSRNMNPAKLVQLCTFGLLAGALMMTRNQVWLFQAGLLLFGLTMGPLFPTLMSLTPVRFGSRISIHAIGFQVSAATLGIVAIPSLAGILGERIGLSAIPWVITVGAAILIVLETLLRTRSNGRGTSPARA